MYHYVYRISNIQLKKYYYGCRSSIKHPKDDLGIKYFSSSLDKEFRNDQKQNPENYRYKVISLVQTREKALSLEIKLHNKFDVGANPSFYNRRKQCSSKFDTTGTKMSIETKSKISKSLKGRVVSETHKQILSISKLGKKHSEAAKQKMRKPKTEEHKRKISENHHDCSGKNNSFYGRKHSEVTKKKLRDRDYSIQSGDNHYARRTGIRPASAFKSGANHPRSIQVYIDGIKYESILQASKATGLKGPVIKKLYVK